MAAPYTSQAISGYNSNPPSDDGSTTEANRVKWSTIKTKLPDPIKTLAEAINAELSTAFGKVVGGGGVTTSAIAYQVLSTDQGKLVKITGSGGVTVTTPSATDVASPFVFGVLNNSTGTITLDGSGSQTVNGVASIILPVGGGCLLWTDGSNWFAVGLQGVLAGKQLMYGDIINGTITASNAANAATFALKTLAGADPSTDDPVLVCFRDFDAAHGDYEYRTITAALSLTIPSTATMGAVSGVAFDLVLALFDDGGTIRLGAINPFLAGTRYYDLTQTPPVTSSTVIGTGSDSAKTWYTNGAGVTTKSYVILAIAKYSSGLVTAGTWNADPSTLQLYGHGITLPGVAKLADTGLQLIATQTASSSATIDFDASNAASAFDGTYDHLVFKIANAKPATDDVEFWLRVGTGATPTYQSGAGAYAWQSTGIVAGVGAATPASASDTEIVLTRASATGDVGNAADECLNATVDLQSPDVAAHKHPIIFSASYTDSAARLVNFNGTGMYLTAGAITAIRFMFESGNIASGVFSLYGLKT